MGYRILLLLLVLIAIFIVAGCSFPNFEAEEQQTETPHKAAFDFQLQDLKGNTIKLSDYSARGGSASGGKNQKVVILNFGATWCPACVEELPELQEYYQNANKEEVEIIWVYTNESESTIKNFRDKHNLEFPIVHDKDGSVHDQYKVSSIPTNVFIDKEGGISEIKIGALDKKGLEKKVSELTKPS